MPTPFDDKDVVTPPGGDKTPDVPEEFKGKSLADLAQMLAAERAEKAAISAQARAQTARLDEMAGKLDKLISPDEGDKNANRQPDWMSQPDKAAEALFDAKIAPYAQAFLSNQEVQQISSISSLKYFKTYESEITELIKRAKPDAKVQPGFGRGVYNFVIGNHFDDIREKEIKEAREEAARQPEFTETKTAAGVVRTPKVTLSAEEQRVAEGLNITPEKYIAQRDRPAEAQAAALKRS